MKRLWTPWRMKYILGKKPKHCIFCEKITQDKDKENHIILRGKTCYIALNKYPYNNGHLMVIPYKHVSKLEELDDQTSLEIMSLLKLSARVLDETVKPGGINIGINLGADSGSSADHIHIHVVPRWHGDTNFMPVLAKTKLIAETLDDTYQRLRSALTGIICE
ncbi:MAG: HIT domain-containing protein [bacterium]